MSFGHDPELPAGFQDADLEMRELEDAANDRRRSTQAKAKQLWESMDDNEKTGVRFGLFPANRMRFLEDEGFNLHEMVCALMDCAKKDGGMRA